MALVVEVVDSQFFCRGHQIAISSAKVKTFMLACRDTVVGVVGSVSDKEVQTLLAAYQKVKVCDLSKVGQLLLHAEAVLRSTGRQQFA